MMPDQRIFSDVAPLSKEAHGDWSLQMEGGYGFTRHLSAAPLVLREMSAAAREYPIVFAREGDGIKPFAILGLKKGENLFVQEDGRWGGSYVPALLRQYPFVIGRVKDSDQALLRRSPVRREWRGKRSCDQGSGFCARSCQVVGAN
jgi:hypothetical protein